MNILIAGSSGFIGQALCSYLSSNGHEVKTLVRRAAKDQTEITWDPANFEIPEHALDGIEVVINLCGTNISDWFWTPKFKQELYESRIKPTRTLVRATSKITDRNLIFISTSGVGIYGAVTNGMADEESPSGKGFFSELALSWEKEALAANSSNSHRVAILRLAIVLGKSGGLVQKIAPLFKLGLGAKLGRGDNLMSWIAVEDVCRGVEQIVNNQNLSGPINFVNPTHPRSDSFYSEIGNAFGRSVALRFPEFPVRAIFSEFAKETIFASQEVNPRKLLQSGFSFKINSVQEAVLSSC